MDFSKLKHRITIQSKSGGVDELGQPLNTWVDVATPRASIIHKSGLQALKADAETSITAASFRIRYKSGLTAGMRIVRGADIYDIKAVLPDLEGRRWVDLICEIGANHG